MYAASEPLNRVFIVTMTAPMRWIASPAITHSAMFGAQMPMRSPGSTPDASSAAAARSTSVASCANVRRRSPSTRASRAPKRSTARSSAAGIVGGVSSGPVSTNAYVPVSCAMCRLPPAELRCPLLASRPSVLVEVLGAARQLHRECLVGEVSLQPDLETSLHEELGEPDRDGRRPDELVDERGRHR